MKIESAPSDTIQLGSDALTVLDILIVVSKHKRTIFIATVLSAIIAAVIAFALPNQYTSRTVLLPPVNEQSAAQMLITQLGVPSALTHEAGLSNPL